ncbi:MAG: hypothetical protein A2074_06435 [Candidatus Aquicultor primus]|uniref:DUF1080 domain-containing protein n=1 Tax=Candidatus Aquicultor primus TaxID=1797195 RepID=A0A1F2UPL8_9ACTN|nr:MAG: hypothetical protein A2074_06435 [Candidatus Aquicultor primus]HCG98476.1 hypothetical protein [Actinomycetota bacterium]
MKRLFWRSFALSLALLVIVLPTNAFALPWGEAAYATNSTGGDTWAYGTFSRNWVMSQPHLDPGGKHVNSIYVRYDPQNIIELGWSRSDPEESTNPQGFTVRSKNGSYEPVALGAITEGQYANFQINIVSGTYNFETWINGVRMYTWTSCGFNFGKTRVGSERVNGGSAGDSNYANFQELKYRNSSGAWGYWYHINDEYLVVSGKTQEDIWYDVIPNDARHSLYINN